MLQGSSLYLDSNVFVYWLEDYPEYTALLEPIFERIEAHRLRAFTSTLTLAEVLVKPHKDRRTELAEQFRGYLCESPVLELCEVSVEILVRAAIIRSASALKLPDAIHVATADMMKCDAFVTNDQRLRAHLGGRCVLLDDYLTDSGRP